MNTYTHFEQVLNADNLYSACMQAAMGNPMVPIDLFPMSGEQWLTALIDGVENHSFAELLDETLVLMLRAVPVEHLEVLANVIDSRPGHVAEDEVLEALNRSKGASETAQSSLSRVVSKALLEGTLTYSAGIRIYGEDSFTRNWLAAAYLCLDHAWAMQQLPAWLAADEEDMLLVCMMGPLTRGELLALKEEAAEPDAKLPGPMLEMLNEQVDRVTKLPEIVERGDTVRWRL